MAEKLQYELTLQTLAAGAGAKETTQGLESVEKAVKKVRTASGDLVKEGRSMDQFLRETSTHAQVSEFALYDLSKAIAKTKNTVEDLTPAATKGAAGTKNMGVIATQAGYQIQDFTVQVGAGTSALTAFAQQAPQFLGIFGPAGAIAGAVVAIGAVAGGIITKLLDDSDSAAERLAKQADRYKQTGDNLAQIHGEIIAEENEVFERHQDWQEAITQNWDATKEASRQYADAALENAKKEISARGRVLELLGKTRDAIKELHELQAVEVDQTNLNAEQQIDAEVQKQRAAQKAAEQAADVANFKDKQLFDKQIELNELKKRLDAANAQAAELEKQSKERYGFGDAAAELNVFPGQKTPEANEAEKALPDVQGTASMLQQSYDALAKEVTALGNETENANIAVASAVTKFKDAQTGTKIAIERIQQTLQADQTQQSLAQIDAQQTATIAETNRLLEAVKARPEEVKKVVNRIFETESETKAHLELVQQRAEAVKEVKDNISKILEDGKITVQESQLLGKNLSTLMGMLQSGQATSNENIQMLINLIKTLQNSNLDLRKRISALDGGN